MVEDDLIAINIYLGEASLTFEEDVKMIGGFPLVEEITALGDVVRTAVINKISTSLRINVVEEGAAHGNVKNLLFSHVA